MTIYRIDVWSKEKEKHNILNKWVQTAHQLKIETLTGCFVARVFFIQGNFELEQINQLSRAILVDEVVEDFQITNSLKPPEFADYNHSIEVMPLPGVTDSVAENLLQKAASFGYSEIKNVATGQRFLLQGDICRNDLVQLATVVFSNPVIQRTVIDDYFQSPFATYELTDDLVCTIPLRGLDDEALTNISNERRLALDLHEMIAIRDYYQNEKCDPTDVEIEMIAQTWSEHCCHKTFKATIHFEDQSTQQSEVIDSLFDTYIRAATEKIGKETVRSAFVDNAGIIAFNDKWDIALKAETHNHPSALEPFGGANTGIGGVIRDILGVSARPIANTDVLCFGFEDTVHEDLPTGVLHPLRVASGVIDGIEDYGNKMGIPTVNGAILYHQGYTANPLVFCGCVGILPHGGHLTGVQDGDFIVVLGGRTGRDGLRGATFSSAEMETSTGDIAGSVVQIGSPIQEKQVLEVVLQARDLKLYNAITDCGAGGLSSAVGEMAKGIGGHVQLEAVPLKYPGLNSWEIWLSEAQERMVMAVPSENWETLQKICAKENVEAVCIGKFETTDRLSLYMGEKLVGDISVSFLHDGIPTRNLKAIWSPPEVKASPSTPSKSFQETLLSLLAHPNIRSKENVIRRYDHEVQGGTAIKPLVGHDNQGPSDAAVIAPLDTVGNGSATKGLVIANGICPQFSEFDPYAMAWAAIDEAIRNAVAIGADPDQIVLLDNFCWGNPNLPDRLGALVRCVQGCYDAAIYYGAPFVSGKDSLNNEYTDSDGQRHAIPGTLLISAFGIVEDVHQTVTMDLKNTGNVLYMVGETHEELGGSHFNLVHKLDGGITPQPQPTALSTLRNLHQAIKSGIIAACHDVSEGGIAVALAEMCIGGGLGANISIDPDDDVSLFSESLTRFIVEVDPQDRSTFEHLMTDTPFQEIGVVDEQDYQHLTIGSDGNKVSIPVQKLEATWRNIPESEVVIPVTASPTKLESTPAIINPSPKVLILRANGTNRDREAALACQMAGGDPEIVHINQLISGDKKLADYQMLVLPGGFSYGDDLGAGVLWATELKTYFSSEIGQFIDDGHPVLGICNGFQALVKAKLLPGDHISGVTLTHNSSQQFECRWVYVQPNQLSPSIFTAGLDEMIYCPVAHGEGRIAVENESALSKLQKDGLIALTYVNVDGSAASYPENPNGSVFNIAGLTNRQGNVMGLMPHPEDHIFAWQHPRQSRGEAGLLGLTLFKNGIKNV